MGADADIFWRLLNFRKLLLSVRLFFTGFLLQAFF